MRVAVAVMAKVPGAAAVKSRLHPALGAAAATRLYESFLRDRLEALLHIGGIDRVIAFTPPEARSAIAELAPPAFALIAQRGADLGARLDAILTELLEAGHPGAIATDSDSPTLPMAYVVEAVTALHEARADVVVGPCDDGGYYLIGVRAPHPALFANMPWSTGRVQALTLERARRAGLRMHVLPPWFDVDTPDDLRRLQRDMARDDTTRLRAGSRRTFEVVEELLGREPPIPCGAAAACVRYTAPVRLNGRAPDATRSPSPIVRMAVDAG